MNEQPKTLSDLNALAKEAGELVETVGASIVIFQRNLEEADLGS
jgi:hypothetical protein